MTWQTVAHVDEFATHNRKLCAVDDRRLAVFRRGEVFVAIDNHCPHRGGPVGAGPLDGDMLTCPWHGLTFNLTSGACADHATQCLVLLPVRVLAGEVQVDVTFQGSREERIFCYLVRYGVPGHVGRFGSTHLVTCRRGDAVVVATDRGEELGEVLVSAEDYDASDPRPPAGELLRVAARGASPEEVRRQQLIGSTAEQILQSLTPHIALLDSELLHDGRTLVLYHLGGGTAELGPLAAQVAARVGVDRVQFETWSGAMPRKVASAAPSTPPGSDGENEMRGPYERLKYDFRRMWECPVCRHRERTSGTVTSRFCACQSKEELTKQVPMKLVDDGPRRTDGQPLPQRKPSLPSL